MKRKRTAVLVLAALMAATTVFPTSAYASDDGDLGPIIDPLDPINFPIEW